MRMSQRPNIRAIRLFAWSLVAFVWAWSWLIGCDLRWDAAEPGCQLNEALRTKWSQQQGAWGCLVSLWKLEAPPISVFLEKDGRLLDALRKSSVRLPNAPSHGSVEFRVYLLDPQRFPTEALPPLSLPTHPGCSASLSSPGYRCEGDSACWFALHFQKQSNRVSCTLVVGEQAPSEIPEAEPSVPEQREPSNDAAPLEVPDIPPIPDGPLGELSGEIFSERPIENIPEPSQESSPTEIFDGVDNKPSGVPGPFCGSSASPICEGKLPCILTCAGPKDIAMGPLLFPWFAKPQSIVITAQGDIYIADTLHHRILKIDNSSQQVSVFAGTGIAGDKNDIALKAQFNQPTGIVLDPKGNLYVADSENHRIRKILPSGQVLTFAGSQQGYLDGAAQQAQFSTPYALVLDVNDNLYVSDSGNHCIRKIDSTGYVTTLAGSPTLGRQDGQATQAQFRTPLGLALNAQGHLYIADSGNNLIRKADPNGNVTTVAGSGTFGYVDAQGIQAQFRTPYSLALNAQGHLYVADYENHRIRKVDPTGNVTTVAGVGSLGYLDGPVATAQLNFPSALAFETSGNLYISSGFNTRMFEGPINYGIRKLDALGNVTTIAGAAISTSQDGAADDARFNQPRGLALDAQGNLYIAEFAGHRIRKIDPSGRVSTIAGDGACRFDMASNTQIDCFRDGPALQAQFNQPESLTFSVSGELYITDSMNYRIRKMDLQGIVSTFAGTGQKGKDGTTRANTKFGLPIGLAFDDKGNLFISDAASPHIRKIEPNGNVSIFAGSGTVGFQEGNGPNALFFFPSGLVFDRTTKSLYLADTSNSVIRRLDENANTSTYAGSTGSGSPGPGYKDGLARTAKFFSPRSIAFDAQGNLFVADTFNHLVRKVDPNGNVSTLIGQLPAGSKLGAGYRDGPFERAALSYPYGIVVDGEGNLYLSDTINHRIRKVFLH